MMRRTFIITGITILTALMFVSFHISDFGFTPSSDTAQADSQNSSIKMIPENLAGVYKGIKPNFVINKAAEANLSPDRRNISAWKEVNFIIIENGVIWMSETDPKDSSVSHYEGTYTIAKNSQDILELSARFVDWNKTSQSYILRFQKNSGKAAAQQEGQPEFEIIHY